MVFDFVDNASQYNMPQSTHRLFQLKQYKAGGLVVAPTAQRTAEEGLYAKGEKPSAIIDYPVDATDYKIVDIFNWQEEAQGMLSQMEFVRRIEVQSETIERYVREGLIVPDLLVPMSEHRTFKYFKEETLEKYAKDFSWTIISDSNRKDLFMEMVLKMSMSYSYKPVLIKAIFQFANDKGQIRLSDIVGYFKEYYQGRKNQGLVVEKGNSLYTRDDYTDKESEWNILSNPLKRFEDMNMIHHTKTLGIIKVDSTVWKGLSVDKKAEIEMVCDEKLALYYDRF